MAGMYDNNYAYPNYGYAPPRMNNMPQYQQPMVNTQQMMNTQQMPIPNQVGNQGYVCRPVTSREEAVAVQVDFFGPGTVMVDMGHGMVYIKRFNAQSGASDFLEFAYKPTQENAPVSPTNAPEQREETKQIYDPRPDIKELYGRISDIEAEFDNLRNYKPAKKSAKVANEE